MSKLSRRAVIKGAGTAAAAGALSTAAAVAMPVSAASPSPELLRWRVARKAYWESCAAHRETIRDRGRAISAARNLTPISACRGAEAEELWEEIVADPQVKAIDAEMTANEETLDAAVVVLIKRPVRSWQDVAELAEMVRGEHRWFPGERDEDDDDAPSEDVVLLFDAIAAMAGMEVGHV